MLSWFEAPEEGAESDAVESLVDLWLRDAESAERVAGLSWVEDGLDSLERDVVEGILEISKVDPVLTGQLTSYSWLVDAPTEEVRVVISAVANIASKDVDLAREVAALPWLADGVTEGESIVLDSFASTGSEDLELLSWAVSLAWLNDGIVSNEVIAVKGVFSLATKVPELGGALMATSWFRAGPDEDELEALARLDFLAVNSVDLARHIAGFSWFSDDVTEDERSAIDGVSSMAARNVEFAEELAGLPWFTDDITEAESVALRALNSFASYNFAFAQQIKGLSWFADGVTEAESNALRAMYLEGPAEIELLNWFLAVGWVIDGLTENERDVLRQVLKLWEIAPDFARAAAVLPWFVDGLSRDEQTVMNFLEEIAEAEASEASDDEMRVQAAITLLPRPWLADGVVQSEAAVIHAIRNIAVRDVNLARQIAGLPWLANEATGHEWFIATTLDGMSDIDLDLTNSIATLPWFSDEISWDERKAVKALEVIASKDLELAKALASLSWLVDGVDADEANSLTALRGLGSSDLTSVKELVLLPWFSGGSSKAEGAVGAALIGIAARDVEFAKEIAALPWWTDGATKLEISAIYSLGNIASKDEGLVQEILSWARYQDGVPRDLDFFLLWALGWADEELLDTLKARTWFTDGVTDEEAALIVTMAGQVPSLYKELLIDSHLYHETISLPLAGDINVWLVQDTNPVLNQESLRQVESAAQIAEEFFGVPFPTTDLIVLLVTEGKREYGHLVRHLGSHMSVIVHRGRLYGIPHEAAHYYLTSNFLGHPWFTEGGANFVEAHVNHERGWQDISSRETVVSKEVQSYCVDSGVENIRHNAYLLDRRHISLFQCTYRLGEYLMLRLLKIMGKNAMSSALNELYVSSGGHLPALRFSTPPTEEEIYGTFLKHAPSQQGRIQKLFQTLHGGEFAFSEIDTGDEEADEAEDAMLVGIGETATGSLDYIFDFDFFKFEAEEGQIYRISVEHETLSHTSVTLYGPDGDTELRNRWQGRVMGTDGPLIQWRALSSEAHFLAVQNFGGKTGEYTFTITPVDEPEADDHGNGVESATRVGRFKEIHGTIDGTFDEDYFRFSAHEGRVYHIFMWPEQTADLCAQMYRADGSRSSEWHNRCDHGSLWEGGSVHGIRWVAPETGDFYLAMSGFMERVGDYKFEIILALDPGNPS